MDWGSEDMTETDDSEYEDPVDRDNRLYVESCNYDLPEGMTPMTYTPPLRRNRRRRYEVRKKYETDIEGSICGTIDDGFLSDEESPNSEHMVQPRTVADNVTRTVRNRNNNRGRWSWPGSENDITRDENSNLFDRPVTKSATAGVGIETDSFSEEHVKCCEIPFTELITVQVPDTEEPLIMRVSTITMELSELGTSDGFLSDEESPNSEHMVQPRTVVDNVTRTVRNRNNNRGRWSRPGSENDITSDENSNLFDRPVTKSATAGVGIETDSFSEEHVKCCEIPVTELITVRVPDTEEPLIMRVSMKTMELSELGTGACSETDISDIPVFKECVIPERRRPVKVSTDADTQVVISDYQRSVRDYCFGVCVKRQTVLTDRE